MHSSFIDLKGQKFGKLTVLERVIIKGKPTRWLCQCDCGNGIVATSGNLRNGHTQSCGCLRVIKNSKHGYYKTKLFQVWQSMLQRCFNPKDKGYKNYGNRGITVCDEWRNSFQSFHDWAYKNGYKEEILPNGINKLTIDRIDCNGNYEPSNCRWITNKEQMNNIRLNRFITINDVSKTISQWADYMGVKRYIIASRLQKGWKPEELLLPLGERRKKKNENIQ